MNTDKKHAAAGYRGVIVRSTARNPEQEAPKPGRGSKNLCPSVFICSQPIMLAVQPVENRRW
jgi:hypothetical protein